MQLFALNSDCSEPDGTSSDSKQGRWLQDQLAASSATWKLVMLHHSPYSSGGQHGSHARLQWPFQEWGADAVLSVSVYDDRGVRYTNSWGCSVKSFYLGPLVADSAAYSASGNSSIRHKAAVRLCGQLLDPPNDG